MPELMTKQDAIEYLLYIKQYVQEKSLVDTALDTAIEALKQPTIEAEPVRHGRWMFHEQKNGYLWKCSNCKGNFDQQFSYCPHCGAKMDGGDLNDQDQSRQ